MVVMSYLRVVCTTYGLLNKDPKGKLRALYLSFRPVAQDRVGCTHSVSSETNESKMQPGRVVSPHESRVLKIEVKVNNAEHGRGSGSTINTTGK